MVAVLLLLALDFGLASCILQEKIVSSLLAALSPYSQSDWLRCPEKNGRLVYKGGQYGIAVFCSVKVGSKVSYDVFRDVEWRARFRGGIGPPTSVVLFLDNQALCQPTVASNGDEASWLPVVLKIEASSFQKRLQSSAPSPVALSCNQIETDWKSVIDSVSHRLTTRFLYPDQQPMTPSVYDLINIDKDGKSLHPIHKLATIQQQIEGETVWDIINCMKADIRVSFREFKATFGKFCEMAPNADHLSSSRLADYTTLTKEKLIRQLGLPLTTFSSVLIAAENRWRQGFLHCDCHLSNVMFAEGKVSSNLDSLTLYRFPKLSGTAEKTISLDPFSARWIDNSNAIDLQMAKPENWETFEQPCSSIFGFREDLTCLLTSWRKNCFSRSWLEARWMGETGDEDLSKSREKFINYFALNECHNVDAVEELWNNFRVVSNLVIFFSEIYDNLRTEARLAIYHERRVDGNLKVCKRSHTIRSMSKISRELRWGLKQRLGSTATSFKIF